MGRASDPRAPRNARSAKRLQLLVMIAALRIIKDAGARNDRGTHAEERNKPSQYPEHCNLPWFLFFSATIVDITTILVCIGDAPLCDHVFAH
jgi:hypothetical protein